MSLRALLHKHVLNAVTAALFALTVWRLGLSPELPAVFAFIFGGVLLAVIDWEGRRAPSPPLLYTPPGGVARPLFAPPRGGGGGAPGTPRVGGVPVPRGLF